MPITIAVQATTITLQAPAELLAAELNLPFVLNNEASFYDYLLVLTPHYLGLQKTKGACTPLYVDFLSAKMRYRQQQASKKNELLARALALKGKHTPKIIDATGGLARDSFVIASLGYDVIVLERSPIIHALVADGMQRAIFHNPSVKNLHLLQTDAIFWLNSLKKADYPEIIYLDPMFPLRKKSALPKQDMLIFHDIVGDDADASALLKTALACATTRVVVKRPRLAASLADTIAPSFSLKGSSSRFDVYLV